METKPVVERTLLYHWQVSYRGIPDGFADFSEYANYLDELFETAGYEEMWFIEDGKRVAYAAWCIGMDAHHKGDIFDVTNIVISPGRKVASKVWKELVELAKLNNCKWISHAKHEADGSLRIIFRRIKHG